MGQIVATAGIKTGAVVVSEPSSLLSEFATQLGKQKKKKGLEVAGEAVVPPPPILVDEKPLALHLGTKTVNKLQAQGEVHGQKNGASSARVDHPLRSLVRESGSQAIADGMSVLNGQQLKTGKSRERFSADSLVGEANKAAARPSDILAPSLPFQAVADLASMQALNDQPLKTGKPRVRPVSDSLQGEGNKICASSSEVSDGVFRASTVSTASEVISHSLAAVAPEGAMAAEQGAPLRSAKVATPDMGKDHLLSKQEQMLAASFVKDEGSFVSRAPAEEAHSASSSEVSDGEFRASTESTASKVISPPLAAVDPERVMTTEQGAPLKSAKVTTPDTDEDHLLSEQEQMLAASFAKGEKSFISREPAKEAHIANLRAKSEDVLSQGASDVAVADQQPDGQMLYRFNRWGDGHSVRIQAQSQEGNLQLELQPSNTFVQDRLHHHLQHIDNTEHWTLLGDSEQQKDQQQSQDPQDKENE
ncbi:SpaN/EivJ family type III secretion system needle length determinant [Iodobacter fluviatilis]|uniref:Antigen presentation protein SpaN n=1 Tax=Iodobacter fluviatilis TaxID=537 RepID=A0A377Q5W9_9NEIS|nr:type III secretion system needle length determinant, SpaN/EivJ family [Iodobacter fluviatilis]TCU86891.1 surface presentation of antigens protein [Iodobacter fluviatilis]STQ90222.1 antigen presentation protein SpaN [Iodobacter fluviatilis]